MEVLRPLKIEKGKKTTQMRCGAEIMGRNHFRNCSCSLTRTVLPGRRDGNVEAVARRGPCSNSPRWIWRFAVWVLALVLHGAIARAGPPFRTDDPEPVAFHHYEFYSFGTLDHTAGTFAQIPAVEFNVGAAPNLQLHLVVPMAYSGPDSAYGAGDIEFGTKYRFVQETSKRPQIGTFPMLELPSGDSRRGLGNGQLWARLPLWVQKSSGPWTTYGGGGYQINRALGMKDSAFAGWLLQRQLTKRLTLGTEVYYQGAQAAGSRYSTSADAGGYYTLRGNLDLLFMVGHSVAGQKEIVGYAGLYYTWGRS